MVTEKTIYKLWQPEHIPITPVGTLKEKGWIPGTYVYYVDINDDPEFILKSGTLACVDMWTSREGASGAKPNRPSGFLWHGVQHGSGDIPSDGNYYLTAKEPRDYLKLDNNNLVDGMGSGIATMVIASTGVFKTYQFEKKNSLGNSITYYTGDLLYVSDNGIWTNEQFVVFGVTGYYAGYQVASVGNDEFGEYLIISNCW